MKNAETLMKFINKSIINNSFNFDEFNSLLEKQNLDTSDKLFILKSLANKELTQVNRDIYDYFYNKEEDAKHQKSMEKFKRNQEGQLELEEAYKQYENYVYSIISLKNYKSKMSKTKSKVKLLSIENLFGHDAEQSLQDVLQEGRTYLWEGLKKFGVLPSKAKNFEGRLDKGHQRNTASKSTFVHQNLKNSLINLSFKSSSDKFTHIPVEFKPEVLGEDESED